MKTKAVFGLLAALTLVLALFAVRPAAPVNADDLAILKFSTLIGVPKGLTGTTSPIRGLNGGGLPWVVAGAEGKLTTTGKLDVQVTGLVLDPTDPTVIARGLAGDNPVGSFRAVVSCLSNTGGVVNVMTGLFPATTGLASAGGGDAEIETTLSLPQPCIAPIIFVTSPGGAWFAVTGH